MTTVKKKDYASFNLPKDLIEDIKILKTAFEATTGKRTSYEEIIKGMMSDLQGSSPDVYAMFERIKESRDGLQTAAVSDNNDDVKKELAEIKEMLGRMNKDSE